MQHSDASPTATAVNVPGRRALLRTGAWAVPVLAAAIAVPMASASDPVGINVGDFQTMGNCGIVPFTGPGFVLTATPDAPVPADTTLLIVGSGVSNIGQFAVLGVTATVQQLGNTVRLITLTSELPAGAQMSARSTLSTSVAFTLSGVVSLPDGYVSGSDAKSTASVSSTLSLCTGI